MQFIDRKMIIGIGIDLVSVKRVEKLMAQFQQKFASKLFTLSEIEQADKMHFSPDNFLRKTLFYAKRFAAKEAFAKAVGLGIGRGIDFRDIEILNDELGKPMIRILNGKDSFLKQHFSCNEFATHISITDEKSMASAFVVIEKIS